MTRLVPGYTGRPPLLDSFCGAGAASMGYHRAGFEVWGSDIFPQPDYPFPERFVQVDALEYLFYNGGKFVAHHGGPPCQASGALGKGTNAAKGWGSVHFDLIDDTRTVLTDWGKPFVIENVSGADMRKDVTLCGEMFRLEVIRHRHFELGYWSMPPQPHVPHRGRVKGVRHGTYYDGPYFAVYGEGGYKGTVAEWQRAMGIDWTADRRAIAEAIPPAYTDLIGRRLLKALGLR